MDDWPDTGGLPGGEAAGRHQAVAGKEPDSTLGETQEDKQWDQLTEGIFVNYSNGKTGDYVCVCVCV